MLPWEGALKFRRLYGRDRARRACVVIKGLQRCREPDHLLVVIVAVLEHCRGVAAGDLDDPAGRMGMKGRKEFLCCRICQILERFGECGPVKAEPHDNVPGLESMSESR